MKKWSKLLSIPVAVTLLAACGTDDAAEDTSEDVTTEEAAPEEEAATDETATEEGTEEESTEEDTEEDDQADAETGASVIQGPEDAQRAFSAEGEWIVILTEDMEVEEDLVLEEQDNEQGERKLAFYESDDDGEVTEMYTLTAPSVTLEAENTRFAGNVSGDVIVDNNGFNFYNEPEIDGDLIFTSEEYQESAEFDESAVSGEVRVEEQ